MPDISVGEIERFLVDEAALLDEWRLEEWLALFAEDGRYLVPSLDMPDSDHRTALFLIADDRRNGYNRRSACQQCFSYTWHRQNGLDADKRV